MGLGVGNWGWVIDFGKRYRQVLGLGSIGSCRYCWVWRRGHRDQARTRGLVQSNACACLLDPTLCLISPSLTSSSRVCGTFIDHAFACIRLSPCSACIHLPHPNSSPCCLLLSGLHCPPPLLLLLLVLQDLVDGCPTIHTWFESHVAVQRAARASTRIAILGPVAGPSVKRLHQSASSQHFLDLLPACTWLIVPSPSAAAGAGSGGWLPCRPHLV